ncbi:MlaD family protein [Sediminibacterium ginsengisoli]|uniref:Phospholipid/cholesterol/gamma-HCH transport system substrate-binding protein n=1 Tax=Sediminibacterium ginsengisoli TaxID=413434 RepID=A0A1T4Q1R8_9BACT|nr:MlaD family protein [Sediminibacterium ginsengisoli]SJZ97467.1 phospholipid/cholesterol/gamma-HCH transport system substrate-binding protein [Sediminibacterium ginsengisoli]
MKVTASQKLKTGLFIAIAFGLLLLCIFLIGKQQNLFNSTFTVQARFKNVSGLQVGNYVRFAGINAGTVNNILIENDTTVRVDLNLQTSVQPYIRPDAVASITNDGLMGDKLVQVSPGSNMSGNLKNGDRIATVNPPDMDRMIAKATSILNNAESITGDLADIVQRVNNGEGSLGRLVSSDKLARELESTVSSTRSTMQSIKKGADGFSDNMDAAKNNFLFRGYFRRKEKERIKDSIEKAKAKSNADLKKKKNE